LAFFLVDAFFVFFGSAATQSDRARDPFLQAARGSVALRRDADESAHDAPTHFHRRGVRLLEDRRWRVGPDTHQESAAATDAAAHMAAHHEAEAAEHLSFVHVGSSGQHRADAPGGFFVVGHGV
jgi:hypothetical protein